MPDCNRNFNLSYYNMGITPDSHKIGIKDEHKDGYYK